ncbi:hypothetical protein LguiA_013440 [Lonicera macranthoides]
MINLPVLRKPTPILYVLFCHAKANNKHKRCNHTKSRERRKGKHRENCSKEEIQIGNATKLLINRFWNEVYKIVLGGGDEILAISYRFYLVMEMGLVTIHHS